MHLHAEEVRGGGRVRVVGSGEVGVGSEAVGVAVAEAAAVVWWSCGRHTPRSSARTQRASRPSTAACAEGGRRVSLSSGRARGEGVALLPLWGPRAQPGGWGMRRRTAFWRRGEIRGDQRRSAHSFLAQ